jgi:hypothetical protein
LLRLLKGSSGKESTDFKETEKERLAHQHQLYKLQYECEVSTLSKRTNISNVELGGTLS